MKYKIYVNDSHDWQLFDVVDNEEKIEDVLNNIDNTIYEKALIITYNYKENCDDVYSEINLKERTYVKKR